jgi:hypothetical protein
VHGFATYAGEAVEQYSWSPFGRLLDRDVLEPAEPPSMSNGFQAGAYAGFRQRAGHQGLMAEPLAGAGQAFDLQSWSLEGVGAAGPAAALPRPLRRPLRRGAVSSAAARRPRGSRGGSGRSRTGSGKNGPNASRGVAGRAHGARCRRARRGEGVRVAPAGVRPVSSAGDSGTTKARTTGTHVQRSIIRR